MTNFPKDFKIRMQSQLGDSWSAFEQAHEVPSPTSIRINPGKSPAKELKPIPWSKFGYYLNERPSFTLDPALHGGSYYVQEPSSMFLEQALQQVGVQGQSLRVLDLCAAPGGKSTHILSLLDRDSLLVSNEVIRSRASILSENIQKWGHDNVVVTSNDPADFGRLPGFFDIVVVDAPCSGEGLFRKDHDAMDSWSPENVDHCSKRQKRILEDIWPALKAGGHLIYSTCTYSPLENEANMQWLSTQQEAESVRLSIDPSYNVEEIQQGAIWGYRLYPHCVMGEGFFLSLVKKIGDPPGQAKSKINALETPRKAIVSQLHGWIRDAGSKFFFQHNEEIRFLPSALTSDLELLAARIYIHYAGTALATTKHDKLIPSHSSALSLSLDQDNFQLLDVSLDDALQYLRKQTLTSDSGRKGFALVRHNGLPIGWANVLPNRINNMYPADWRIRI